MSFLFLEVMGIENLGIFLITLSICMVGRFVIYLVNKKRGKQKKSVRKELMPIEIKYLNKRFGLKMSKIYKNCFMLLVSFIDGLILSVTAMLVMLIPRFIYLQMLVGLGVLLGLIFVVYEVLGRILVRKGDKK